MIIRCCYDGIGGTIDGVEMQFDECRMEEERCSVYTGRTFTKQDYLEMSPDDKKLYHSLGYKNHSFGQKMFVNGTKEFQKFLLQMEKIEVKYIDREYLDSRITLAQCYITLFVLDNGINDALRFGRSMGCKTRDRMTDREILNRVLKENTPSNLMKIIEKYAQEESEMQKDIAGFKQKRQEAQTHQGGMAWVGVMLIVLWFIVYISVGGQHADWRVQLILILCLPVLLFGIFKTVNKAGGTIDDEAKKKMKKWGDDWDK